jgi:hypothetical protein
MSIPVMALPFWPFAMVARVQTRKKLRVGRNHAKVWGANNKVRPWGFSVTAVIIASFALFLIIVALAGIRPRLAPALSVASIFPLAIITGAVVYGALSLVARMRRFALRSRALVAVLVAIGALAFGLFYAGEAAGPTLTRLAQASPANLALYAAVLVISAIASLRRDPEYRQGVKEFVLAAPVELASMFALGVVGFFSFVHMDHIWPATTSMAASLTFVGLLLGFATRGRFSGEEFA